jgi:hypothetical protein
VSGLSATRQLLVGKQFIAGQSSNAKRQIIGSQVRAPVAAYFWKQVAAFIHYQQPLPEKANPLSESAEQSAFNPPLAAL